MSEIPDLSNHTPDCPGASCDFSARFGSGRCSCVHSNPVGEAFDIPKQREDMVSLGRDIEHGLKRDFIRSFRALQKYALENARSKGWNIESDVEQIAMIHSEVTEALLALRDGNGPDSKVPDFSGVEVELGDVIIRTLTLSGDRGWRVGEAIIAKMLYNLTPEAAADAYGKAF